MGDIGTYFDVVLGINNEPIFNGTPDEVKAFLEANKDDPWFDRLQVCLGTTLTMTSTENYLRS